MNSEDIVFQKLFTLNNGVQMPSVGLGTYRIRNADAIFKSIDYALAAGYRMIDTAAVYGNETYIKNALQALLPKYGLQRKDIFITTKLAPSDHGESEVTSAACRKSLENLGLDYVDLYLIHFPGSAKVAANSSRNIQLRDSTWKGLTELYHEGLVKSIGVSNFTVRHLKELMSSNHGVVPVVNQVEWHPYYHENDLLKYCKDHNIVLQAYCSLGGTSSEQALLQDPIVKKIAEKHNASCAQVLLVWALQQEVAIIPKSTDANRIKENIRLNFKLTDSEMMELDALGKKKVKFAWDPHAVA